jgi:hypothetical protein
MTDKFDKNLELQEPPDLIATEPDSAVSELTEEVNAEILASNDELEILTDQVKDIYNDPDAPKILRPLDDDEEARFSLQYPERIFVESYCRPSHVFVPQNGKAASLPELAVFYHKVPLSPVLFQDSVLENAFGIKFKHKQHTEEGLRERQSYFAHLRMLFAKLTSLPHKKNYDRDRNKIKRIFVIPIEQAKGKLLITRMAPDRRVNSIHPDIYSAYRSQSHILNNYDGTISEKDAEVVGEFRSLLNLTEKLQFLISFIQRWKSSSANERRQMAQILEEAKDLLANSQNRLKESALGRAESSVNFIDSRGRTNPCATAPKILAMGKDLFGRLDQLLSIRSKIAKDKQTLETILSPLHATFFAGTLELGSVLEDDYFNEIDTEDPHSYGNVKYKCALVNRELFKSGGILRQLDNMANDKHMPAPFAQYAGAVFSNFDVVRRLNQYIDQNKNEMTPYRLKEIHDELCKHAIVGYVVMKYQFIHRTYHEILTRVLEDPEKIDYDEERKKLNALNVRLRPHEYQKDFDLREDLEINLPGLRGLYEHIQFVIAKITEYKKRMELKADEEIATEQEAERLVELKTLKTQLTIEFRDEIREIIKDFDFNELIKEAHVDEPETKVEAFIFQLS